MHWSMRRSRHWCANAGSRCAASTGGKRGDAIRRHCEPSGLAFGEPRGLAMTRILFRLARHHDQRICPESAGALGEAAELPEMAASGEAPLDREAEALEHGCERVAERGPEDAVDGGH